MKVLHIVGRKNHGKTALVTELVRAFCQRGLRVGTVKHCAHGHEIDTPGKDSYLHRHAGASCVAVLTPDLVALFQARESTDAPYAQLRSSFRHCDLVLIEGNIDGPGPKFEVWRQAVGTPPLASERQDILGIVTDDPVDSDLPVWPRQDVPALSGHVLARAGEI